MADSLESPEKSPDFSNVCLKEENLYRTAKKTTSSALGANVYVWKTHVDRYIVDISVTFANNMIELLDACSSVW